MKIAYLGAGAWGFCLANLLAANGHKVKLWTKFQKEADALAGGQKHPRLHCVAHENITVTTDLKGAIEDADLIVESVTSQGFRFVLNDLLAIGNIKVPFVITSKGIEQDTGKLLSEVAVEVLGEGVKELIGCLSGPSIAQEVMEKLPTSVVCSSYNKEVRPVIQEAFNNTFFRVYPNNDMIGISFGGAMKNIIAIACGIASGLGFGENTKAALMTRGLHEMRKLSKSKGCLPETINGLSGMGDLCVTCASKFSRNNIFGELLAEGYSAEDAKEKIGMVVEGAYTCVSALQLSKKTGVSVPITQAVYSIIYEGLDPKKAVKELLTRPVKDEHR